jgi:hypothetical protein
LRQLELTGWPYDIHSYVDVAPFLASAGYRVIVPYVRGYGPTRVLLLNADGTVVTAADLSSVKSAAAAEPASPVSTTAVVGVRGIGPTLKNKPCECTLRHMLLELVCANSVLHRTDPKEDSDGF